MVNRSSTTGQYLGPGGGPGPAHEELSIRGPFRGFQTDLDEYHPQDYRVAGAIQNVDSLELNLVTRPGLRKIVEAADIDFGPSNFFWCSGDPEDSFTTNIYAIFSGPGQDSRGFGVGDETNPGWRLFMWGQYYLYVAEITADVDANGNTFFDRYIDPTRINWSRVEKRILTIEGPPGVNVMSYVNNTQVDIGGGLGPATSVPEMYRVLTYDGGSPSYVGRHGVLADFREITNVSGSGGPGNVTLTVGRAYAGPFADVGYSICSPIVDRQTDVAERSKAPIGTDATRVYRISDYIGYYISGSPGGTYFEPFENPYVCEFYQEPTDTYHWVADCSMWFANRLIIGTSMSYRYLDEATGLPLPAYRNDPASEYLHEGRLVLSSNGNPRIMDPFTDKTAAFYDIPGGRVHDLFMMRDRGYIVNETSIYVMDVTGNPYNPVRIRPLITNRQFTVRTRAVVVDGIYAYVACADGVYRFDGSSLQPISQAIDEHYRGMYSLLDPRKDNQIGRGLTTPNKLFYDDTRSRVFVSTRNTNDEVLVHDVRYGDWRKHRFGDGLSAETIDDTIPVNGMATWTTSDFWLTSEVSPANEDPRQLVEAFLFTDDKRGDQSNILYALDRSVIVDDPTGIASQIDWYWESAELDFDDPRTDKSIKRIRITYESTTANQNRVQIDVYKDGGITPEFTGNIDMADAVVGAKLNGFETVPGGVTGNTFRFRLSGMDPEKVIIKEVAVTFLRRLEMRQA